MSQLRVSSFCASSYHQSFIHLLQIVTQFKEQGINTELYYKNKEMGKDTFSIIPTSAIRCVCILSDIFLLLGYALLQLILAKRYCVL